MDKVNKNIRALYTPFWVWTLRKRRQMESKTLETFSISSEKFSVKENDDNAPPPPTDPWYEASYMGWFYSGIIILIVVIILYAIWFQQLSLWFKICCLIFAIVFGPIGGAVSIVLLALYHTGVISN